MNLNNPIGGFFELELNNLGTIYHDDAIAINSGRNAFEYILIQNQYDKIYLPYYTCEVILQPIIRQKLEYEFYYLDHNLAPKVDPIGENEALLYINYFGILSNFIERLKNKFRNLLIDNSQAFFDLPLPEVPAFYSPRKFFGIPDGGFAYNYRHKNLDLKRDISIDRFRHLLKRIELGPEAAYRYYKINEKKINHLPLRKMSKITEKLLKNIDFERIKQIRRTNFNYYHDNLSHLNELRHLIDKNEVTTPMVYPFYRKDNSRLRKVLIKNNIFIPKYWPGIQNWIECKKSFELDLIENLIPLPIDQRYSSNEIQNVLKNIIN